MWYTTSDLEYWQNYEDCPQNSLIFGESSRAEVEFYMVIKFETQMSSTAVFSELSMHRFNFMGCPSKFLNAYTLAEKKKYNMI